MRNRLHEGRGVPIHSTNHELGEQERDFLSYQLILVNRGPLFRPWFWWYCRLGDEIRIQSQWRLAGWSLLSSCWKSLASGFRTSLSFCILQGYWLQKRPTQSFRIKRKNQKTTAFLKHSHTDTVKPCCSVSFWSPIRVIESCKNYHT